MRKGRDGEKKTGKTGKKWEKKENTDENSGHYVIASSRPPKRRPLERRTLAPNKFFDPNTPSMREGCDGEKKRKEGEKRKKNSENSGSLSLCQSTALTPTNWNADR